MLAADGAAAVAAIADAVDVGQHSRANPGEPIQAMSQAPIELVLIASDVDDAETLIPNASRDAEIVILDPALPGIDQITNTLARYRNVAAVHLVTHGRDGAIRLGGQWIDAAALLEHQGQVTRWQKSLAKDAEILLYACDAGRGQRGASLVQTLASLTQRETAASTDRTASVASGGNWTLERAVGRIDTSLVFTPESLSKYRHSLSLTIFAAGQTNEEQMRLVVNDQVVATWNNIGGNANTGVFATYTFAVASSVTADQVRIEFTNDVYDPVRGIDRNLRIDRIVLNGTTIQTESPQVFSTGTWLPEDQIVAGFRRSEYLHASGYFQFGTRATIDDEVTILARGEDGRENMSLLIDGTVVRSWSSIGTTLREFRHTASSALRPEQIRVAFTNDRWEPAVGIDYNLQVDAVRIGPTLYQTEAPTVFSTGSWLPSDGVVAGFRRSEVLNADGYFQYAVAPTAPGVISLETSVIDVDETSSQVNVFIRRTQGTQGIVTVDYRTIDQTATAGSDYVAASGTAVFGVGIDRVAIPITILNDSLPESNETFGFAIDNVQGGASLLAPRTATIRIIDDETSRPGDGLTGEYFDNIDFTNRKLVRKDATVNFNWGSGSPASVIGSDTFSVRWTGKLKPQFSETYTFHTTSDDGVRLWIDDQLVINSWVDQTATVRTGTVTLEAGRLYDIKMEYYERSSAAVASLAWSSPRQPLQIIPQSRLYSVPALPVPQDLIRAETIVSSLTRPTAIDFTPDGRRMYIAQQDGLVRVRVNGVLNSTPFIDIRAQVNGTRDRGLLDIAVHPDFEANPYVYLLYTYDPPEVFQNASHPLAGPDKNGNRAARLVRVTADAATNYTTAVAGSEVVLLGGNSTWQNFNAFVNSTVDFDEPAGGYLPDGTPVRDFIATDSESHTIGSVEFAKDGSLFVSTGDGASYNRVDPRAVRVQNIDDLAGKILRIDPITGQGLPDNPFYNGDPNANRSKVYQYGLRNPFRVTVDPVSGRLYVGDVGWTQWEEINSGAPGANFGWPYFEGGSTTNERTTRYQDLPEAQAFYASGQVATPPVLGLNHGTTGINAIISGDFVPNAIYPEVFRNTLLFNDLGQGIVRAIRFNAAGGVDTVTEFQSGARVVVQIVTGPDGLLYFVDLDDGIVGRWNVV